MAAFLYRRQCLETIGVYEPTLNGAEDWDMWLRIVERYPVVAVPELLYYYREHDDSMTARIQPDIMAASRRVIDRALARRNGGIDLQEFYPAIGECSDRELATTHATLDFGIRLLRSHVAPPELAARFLAAAFERQPDPRTAANLMVAFARCGDSTSARRLADHLRTEGQPEIRHLVELVTAETDANADRLRQAPVLELSASESELLRKLAAGRLIHSFTAGGEQLPLETNEPAVTTVPVSPQSAPKDSLAEIEATIREALALRPDGVEAWQLLAALHVQRKDWVAGAQAGQRLLQLDPSNVKSLMLLAHCLLGGGDGETAILVFQRVLELEPGNTMARACLTDLTAPEAEPASEAEAYARAERNVRQVLRLEPDNVAAHRLLANVLAGQHR